MGSEGNNTSIEAKEVCEMTAMRPKNDSKEDEEAQSSPKPKLSRDRSSLRSLLGVFVLFSSASFFTSSNALVKLIEDVDAFTLSAIRYAVVAVVSAIILVIKRLEFFPRGYRVYLVLRGLLGSFTLIVHFYALKQMPMGDVNMISASTPVITVFLAWLILREPVEVADVVHALLVCVGVALITQPPILFGESEQYVKNTNYGLAATLVVVSNFTMATAFIVLRMLKDVHFSSVLFVYGVEGCLCSTVAGLVLTHVSLPSSTMEWSGSMAIGILSFLAQGTMTIGCQLEQAALVSLLRKTLDAFLAFALQFLIFNEFPNVTGALGIVLMIAVVLSSGLNKVRKSVEQK